MALNVTPGYGVPSVVSSEDAARYNRDMLDSLNRNVREKEQYMNMLRTNLASVDARIRANPSDAVANLERGRLTEAIRKAEDDYKEAKIRAEPVRVDQRLGVSNNGEQVVYKPGVGHVVLQKGVSDKHLRTEDPVIAVQFPKTMYEKALEKYPVFAQSRVDPMNKEILYPAWDPNHGDGTYTYGVDLIGLDLRILRLESTIVGNFSSLQTVFAVFAVLVLIVIYSWLRTRREVAGLTEAVNELTRRLDEEN